MRVCRHQNARGFLDRAQAWLVRSEVENGLLYGLALRVLSDDSPNEPPFFATVEQDDEIVGCASRTPPFPVALSSLPAESIEFVAEAVRKACGSIPGVVGPVREATLFADSWVRRSGGSWSTRFGLRNHALSEVAFPDPQVSGTLRTATEADTELADLWTEAFVRETGITPPAYNFGERLIGEKRLYFWDDGEPRCMVASTRETPNVAWINTVYTPLEFRGRGYAAAAVATFSQLLLDSGRALCALYTDLANPTSNEVYRRIGYEAVADAIELEFSEAKD